MIADSLKGLTREELVIMALKHNLPKPHHKTSAESIIKQIMDVVTHPATPIKEEVKVQKKELVFSTPEQVEEIIAPLKAKNPNFQAIYDMDSRSVTFRCNGAEDSINLSAPLDSGPHGSSIIQKARLVSRGRLALRGHAATNFDPGNAGGNSAYTNVVLA